jgi:hypothetical protein
MNSRLRADIEEAYRRYGFRKLQTKRKSQFDIKVSPKRITHLEKRMKEKRAQLILWKRMQQVGEAKIKAAKKLLGHFENTLNNFTRAYHSFDPYGITKEKHPLSNANFAFIRRYMIEKQKIETSKRQLQVYENQLRAMKNAVRRMESARPRNYRPYH